MWQMGPTILIVDDHRGFRASARDLLEADGFVVVGESDTGRGALADSARLRPDVVLLDIQLPDIDGFAVAERLSMAAHAPAVIFISSRAEGDFGDRLTGVVNHGFVAKGDLSGLALANLLA